MGVATTVAAGAGVGVRAGVGVLGVTCRSSWPGVTRSTGISLAKAVLGMPSLIPDKTV